MTAAEQAARAIQRAHDEHVHIFKTERAGVYTTKSKSDPSERYTLVANADGVACSCKGYLYRKECKHREALISRLAREAAKTAPAPVAQSCDLCDLYPPERGQACRACGLIG